MKNSDISSALATPPPSNGPARKSFSLQGRTVSLDPRTHAVRPELKAGEAFEVLELAGGHAWGIAPLLGLVGYCDATLLEPVQ